MLDSDLRAFLLRSGCFIKATEKEKKARELTHVCLHGGRLSIPNELVPEFYKLYSAGLLRGDKFFLCERLPSSGYCKMFCDFDFAEPELIPTDILTKTYNYLYQLTNNYFGTQLPFAILHAPVKTIPPKTGNEVAPPLYKTGIHLVWKDLILTKKDARNLATQFILFLKDHLEIYKWEKIIDLGVYESGLRMPGSMKWDKKNSAVEERPYTIQCFYPPSEKISFASTAEMILALSIRCYHSPCVMESIEPIEDASRAWGAKPPKPPKSPKPNARFEGVAYEAHEAHEAYDGAEGAFGDAEGDRDAGENELGDVVVSESGTFWLCDGTSTNLPQNVLTKKLIQEVTNYMKNHTVEGWRSFDYIERFALETSEKKNSNQRYFIVVPKTLRYCLNVEREHYSNRVKFMITASGFIQLCYCTCEDLEGRKTGKYCKSFMSAPFPLPFKILKALFPDLTVQNAVKQSKQLMSTKQKTLRAYDRVKTYPTNLDLKKKSTLPKYLEMSMATIGNIQDRIKQLRTSGHPE